MIIGKIPCFLVIKFVTIENRNLWLSEDKLTFLSLSKGIYFSTSFDGRSWQPAEHPY